jgi:hypothetical protein
MKKLIHIICLGLMVQHISAQVSDSSAPSGALSIDDEQIHSVNKIVDEIRSGIKQYRKVEKVKNKTGFNCGYFKGSDLMLIQSWYKDTITEKNTEWYFQNGKFIYSRKLWTDIKTKDTLEYERYYLSNEKLIAWFKFDKPVDKKSEPFRKVSIKLRDYVGDLKLEYVK